MFQSIVEFPCFRILKAVSLESQVVKAKEESFCSDDVNWQRQQ